MLAGADWNGAIFEDPTLLLDYGARASGYARAGMVLDVLGYYLLLVPALIILCRSLAARDGVLASVAQIAGISYVVVGATGAAILAAVWPATLDQVGSTDAVQRAALTASFDTTTEAVFAMWNLFGSTALAILLLITARLLWSERRAFSIFSTLIGAACAIDATATAMGVDAVGSAALQVYLYGAPIWAAWLGVLILRKQSLVSTT